MSVAAFHRVLTAVAVLASLAAAGYLWNARGDEAALADANAALLRGDPVGALAEARAVGDGGSVAGRAAALEGRAAAALGDVTTATARLREAVRERPNDWRLRRDLAIALATAGDRTGASAQARRALALNPRATLPSGFEVRVGGR